MSESSWLFGYHRKEDSLFFCVDEAEYGKKEVHDCKSHPTDKKQDETLSLRLVCSSIFY